MALTTQSYEKTVPDGWAAQVGPAAGEAAQVRLAADKQHEGFGGLVFSELNGP